MLFEVTSIKNHLSYSPISLIYVSSSLALAFEFVPDSTIRGVWLASRLFLTCP